MITIRQDNNYEKYAFIIGIIPIIWVALLIAPYTNGGLVNIVKNYSSIFENPFKIEIVNNSLKTVIVLLGIYAMRYIGRYMKAATRKMICPLSSRQGAYQNPVTVLRK